MLSLVSSEASEVSDKLSPNGRVGLVVRLIRISRKQQRLSTPQPAQPAKRRPPEWTQVVRDLDRVEQVELDKDGRRFLLRTEAAGVSGKVFQAVGVALPQSSARSRSREPTANPRSLVPSQIYALVSPLTGALRSGHCRRWVKPLPQSAPERRP